MEGAETSASPALIALPVDARSSYYRRFSIMKTKQATKEYMIVKLHAFHLYLMHHLYVMFNFVI